MNRELASLFNNRIDTLVASYAGAPTVLVFIGLGPVAAQALIARPDSLSSLTGVPVPMKSDGIDPVALFDKKALRCTRNAVEDCDGPVVCLYEQFKPFAKSLADSYEGRIVIVSNNLFADEGYYPTPISVQDVADFAVHIDESGEDDDTLSCGKL